jgi:hypothetical protein
LHFKREQPNGWFATAIGWRSSDAFKRWIQAMAAQPAALIRLP